MDDIPVDDAPTSGSANLVTSGGVYDAINTATQYVPTSAGTAGQVWTSDGAGAGAWKNLIIISTSEPTESDEGLLWVVYKE